LHVGCNGVDHAGCFHPGDVWERRFDQVFAAQKKRIAKIDSDDLVFDQDGSGPKLGLWHVAQLHDFSAAEPVELDRFHWSRLTATSGS
jgi:hypothetical protein